MPEPPLRLAAIDRRVSALPYGAKLALALLLLLACAVADDLSGSELSFSITYLAPTALAAWYAGSAAGASMAVLSALVWLWLDLGAGQAYGHPFIPYWNALVRFGFFLLVTLLLLKIRRLLSHLSQLAETDGLTGLLNSRSFYDHLRREKDRAKRYRHTFTVAYIDLDNFKKVNDTLGHQTGDEVLRTIAAALRSGLRDSDLVARLGGDEFALLLVETGETEATEALRKLHRLLQETITRNGWPIGCSIGAVVCRGDDARDVQQLVQLADDLMYQVKRSGKNRLEVIRAEADPQPGR